MTTSPEQFTGTPLVAGEVLGVRAWRVDSLGRIKSPSYSHIWTPGENVANCQKDTAARGGAVSSRWYITSPSWSSSSITYSMPSMYWAVSDEGREPKDVDQYVGFAARQFPGWTLTKVTLDKTSNLYELELERTKGRNGRRIKGSPERRSERVGAEVVDAYLRSVPMRTTERPPDPPHEFSSCTCGFYAYMNGTNDYADHNVIGVIQGYGETFLGTRGFRSSKARIVAAYASTHADVERVRPLPVSMDRMRELYPDVAWFHDYAAMVAEFPPSDPEPTPDTDDNFWTRSA